MSIKDGLYHKRLREFEAFDEITFKQTERYKTSGLSGDEWRFSIRVNFLFKGNVVYETEFHDMQTALLMIGNDYMRAQSPIPQKVIDIEGKTCSQPACKEEPVARFQLKRETAPDGQFYDKEDVTLKRYRAFCKKHLRRGDCSREDSDDNYIQLDGIGPEDSTNKEESPAHCMIMDLCD